jgi:hypothetical protein
MEKNKLNEANESLERIKLLMSYRNDMTLTENEEKLKNNLLVEARPTKGKPRRAPTPASRAKPSGQNPKSKSFFNKIPPKYKFIGAALAAGASGAAFIWDKIMDVYPDTKDELQSWYVIGKKLIDDNLDKASLTGDQIDNAAREFYKAVNLGGLTGEDETMMVSAINKCVNFIDFKNLVDEYTKDFKRNLIDDFVDYTQTGDYDSLNLKNIKAEIQAAVDDNSAAGKVNIEISKTLNEFKNFIKKDWEVDQAGDKVDIEGLFPTLEFGYNETTGLYEVINPNETNGLYEYEHTPNAANKFREVK